MHEIERLGMCDQVGEEVQSVFFTFLYLAQCSSFMIHSHVPHRSSKHQVKIQLVLPHVKSFELANIWQAFIVKKLKEVYFNNWSTQQD